MHVSILQCFFTLSFYAFIGKRVPLIPMQSDLRFTNNIIIIFFSLNITSLLYRKPIRLRSNVNTWKSERVYEKNILKNEQNM